MPPVVDTIKIDKKSRESPQLAFGYFPACGRMKMCKKDQKSTPMDPACGKMKKNQKSTPLGSVCKTHWVKKNQKSTPMDPACGKTVKKVCHCQWAQYMEKESKIDAIGSSM